MIDKILGVRKARQIYRFIRHCKTTILCLLLTIIVLRGTIGAGKFGTPKQDYLEIRNHFSHRHLKGVQNFNYKSHFHDHDNNVDINNNSSDNYVTNFGSRTRKVEMGYDGRREKMRPRVLLVTGSLSNKCENMVKFVKNKVDYCRLHGIEILYDEGLYEAEMLGFSAKLEVIRKLLLKHPEVEFLWWMDSDVMFTDMVFEVPWERYEGFNLVVHGVGLSSGSFMIRNCRWSSEVLEEWSEMVSKRRVRVDEEGKGMMVYLLSKEKEKWGGKVYLENGCYEEISRGYGSGFGDRTWPLVAWFVGCKPCGKVGDFGEERCLKLMDRAFNFVDNQMKNASLSSRRVKRIRNKDIE